MTRASFDALVRRLAESPTTFSERELLEPSHWSLGEDARLREDLRFRETPWGRWMLAEDVLANETAYRWLHAERRSMMDLAAALKRAGEVFGRRCVFCVDDPRFVLRRNEVHLAAGELSRQPVVEDTVGDREKYRTHLPLHSLRAAAASGPAGEWGQRAQDQVIEPVGWVRVSLPGRQLNDRMFVAAMEGHSMDDGRSGLVDGGYAVFELWPSGTKQNMSVLVRGAFADPETGSFAVKKYVADQRDEEGRHNTISLVSLNPDKERYPDILLRPENDDDITVVAKVVQALSTDDYERRPKEKRRIGRRDLTCQEQARRLALRVASFFDGAATDADDEFAASAVTTGWQSRLVCLDVSAGGLQLEIGPLAGLPSFVKKLRAIGCEWDAIVLAANAKSRPTRVTVHPRTGPWRWEAVGFEEERELGLDRLDHDALDTTSPTVFRIDMDGIGQRIKGTTLSFGQSYHVLLPPNLGQSLGNELHGGWRVWSLDFATQPAPPVVGGILSIGLSVGDASPRLEWGLFQASAWRTNARGESYPVFTLGTELVVNVSGVSLEEDDEVALFLKGPAGAERLALASDGPVSLGTLEVGKWICALLHSRVNVRPATLIFEVAQEALGHIPASWSAVAPGGLKSIEATAPPGWPISIRWRVVGSYEEPLATLYGNDDRTVPVEDIASIIDARAARARLADLILDCGELGSTAISHDGRASLKQVREQLTELWQQRSEFVQSHAGAWLQLMPTWFTPVLTLFGYGIESLALSPVSDPPHCLAAYLLTVDERMMGVILRSHSRVLVLTNDLNSVLTNQRAWLDAACSAGGVRDAIVTDGTSWTTHRKGSQQLKQHVWNLDLVIGFGRIDDMLGDLAEGL